MKKTLIIAWRELRAYFSTPMGWLCLLGFVAITGVFFFIFTSQFSAEVTRQSFNPYDSSQLNLTDWLIQPSCSSISRQYRKEATSASRSGMGPMLVWMRWERVSRIRRKSTKHLATKLRSQRKWWTQTSCR